MHQRTEAHAGTQEGVRAPTHVHVGINAPFKHVWIMLRFGVIFFEVSLRTGWLDPRVSGSKRDLCA